MLDFLQDPKNSAVIALGSVIIAALVAGSTTLIVALVSYPRQKKLDREDALRERYFAVHLEMAAAIANLASSFLGNSDKDEAQRRYAAAVTTYAMVASDDAARALGKWNDLVKGVRTPKEGELDQALSKWMFVARRDLFPNSGLTDAELLSLTPLSPNPSIRAD